MEKVEKVKVMWAKVHDTILDETEEKLVIVRRGVTYIGTLMFRADSWEEVSEIVESSTIPDRTEKVLTTAYAYLCRYNRKHNGTLKTLCHWAFINGVIDDFVVDAYGKINDEELLVKLSEGSVW